MNYGAKWSAAMGEKFADSGPTGTFWQRGLVGITANQIDMGMVACAMRAEDWPPSVRDFRALCLPQREHVNEWKSQRADPKKMPSAERLKWHQLNIAWIKSGHELPRTGAIEPPAPLGSRGFASIYESITGLEIA